MPFDRDTGLRGKEGHVLLMFLTQERHWGLEVRVEAGMEDDSSCNLYSGRFFILSGDPEWSMSQKKRN